MQIVAPKQPNIIRHPDPNNHERHKQLPRPSVRARAFLHEVQREREEKRGDDAQEVDEEGGVDDARGGDRGWGVGGIGEVLGDGIPEAIGGVESRAYGESLERRKVGDGCLHFLYAPEQKQRD